MTTITISRATVEQALEALKDDQYRLVEVSPNQYEYKTDLAIAALERALAQQAEPVEPVAWMESPHGAIRANPLYKIQFPSQLLSWQIPLYTSPPQRKPLTEEEILEMAEKAWKPSVYYDAAALLGTDGLVALVRAIERAHKIGDNT